MTISTPIHTNPQSIDRVLNAGVPVLLVFTRRDCQTCAQLAPALNRLAGDYAGRALIAQVDAQEYPDLARRFEVTRLPGLVFVQQGRSLARSSGVATEAALRAWFEYLTAGGARPPLPEGPSVPIEGHAPPPPAAGPRPAPATGAPPPRGAAGPVVLTDATFDRIVGAGDQPVLVDFWAPWCGPCRMVAPAVERLAHEFAGRAVVAKLNVDENPYTAQRFGISGIPALYIFKRGRVVERLVGAQPESVLRQALARHV
jgi:thioredoxin 1